MQMFLSMEDDEIEEEAGKEKNIKEPKAKKGIVKADGVDLEKTLEKIKTKIKKTEKDRKITPKVINTYRVKMLKKGELTKKEGPVVFDWFKKQERMRVKA